MQRGRTKPRPFKDTRKSERSSVYGTRCWTAQHNQWLGVRTCAGLCCAALLAKYGKRVTVCESHYIAGGAAHGFDVKGFHFDAGPSFFAGLSGASRQALRHLRRHSPQPVLRRLKALRFQSRASQEEHQPSLRTQPTLALTGLGCHSSALQPATGPCQHCWPCSARGSFCSAGPGASAAWRAPAAGRRAQQGR
jgi:hypothetical protein